MKIGFIGVGNMGSAILRGVLDQGDIKSSDIYISNYHYDVVDKLANELGVNGCQSNSEVMENADIIIIGVKPNVLETVLGEANQTSLNKNKVIVSIAAGIDLEQLYSFLPTDLQKEGIPIVRVMPNMNVTVKESASGICGNEYVTDEQIKNVEDIFGSVGKVWNIAEKDFSTYAAIAGCSPAYIYLFMDSMARAAVKNGLPKQQALEIVTQAVLGSAKMIETSDKSPWDIIDMVCSPGGTTVEGLVELENNAFISTVIKGIDAAIQKDKDLSK